MLIDGNLRAPSLWKLFEKDAKHPGLAELVALPTLAPRDVLADGPVPDLQLLLAGPVSVIPTERLTSERVERILDDLREHADLVIIDAPPPLADSNTLLFAMNADHTIVVARADRTRSERTAHDHREHPGGARLSARPRPLRRRSGWRFRMNPLFASVHRSTRPGRYSDAAPSIHTTERG